jgi:catechol 2,3-dioxygenase-like lactoylglutathione lyase family enzyme
MPNGDSAPSLATSPLIAFLATADAARCRHFFERVLRLRFVSDDQFALVFESKGTMLRIQKVDVVRPATHTVLGWQAEDITQLVGQLAERGVQFERYPGLVQDGLGIWSSPAAAKVVWFKDPDGNILSLTQLPNRAERG